MKKQIIALALAGAFSIPAQAVTLFSENFDSYINGAAATTIPGITTSGFGTGDSATVSNAQFLSGANSLRYTMGSTTAPFLNFNFASVTAANAANGLNLSFSYQKGGDAYDPNIWTMFNGSGVGFFNGNFGLRNNGLNNFDSIPDPGFQFTGQGAAWQTVNVAYTFTNNGTNITGWTGNFTTSGGAASPSFSVVKTGLTIASIDSLRLQFRGAAGDVYLDNIVITDNSVIPEPSTYAALFGAAVLGLAAFRRRRA